MSRAGQMRTLIPARLRRFATPTLMVGECLEEYEELRDLLIADLAPQTSIEWLWLFDLAELSWEILRYRKLKNKVLETYRMKAIEALLLQVDGAGIAEDISKVRLLTRRNALDWQADIVAGNEIERRLAQFGFDTVAINAEIFVQARELLSMFDGLLHAAQVRRNLLLREMRASTALAPRIPKALERPAMNG